MFDFSRFYNTWNQEIKDKCNNNVLLFNVSDGWGPLCEYLDCPVPKQKFPRQVKPFHLDAHFKHVSNGQIKRLGSPGPSQKVSRVPNISQLPGHVLPRSPHPLVIQLKYKVYLTPPLCKYVQNINQSEANDCTLHACMYRHVSPFICGIETVIVTSCHIRIRNSFCSWRQIKMKVVEPGV